MAMQIHQFQQHADDLECGHSVRWAGAIESSAGDHLIAMGCAKCVSSQSARDTLREFALYVHLSEAVAPMHRSVSTAPKVMTAH